MHGTTKKTPLELHAQEVPYLLPLPALQFGTAQVVCRAKGDVLAAMRRAVMYRALGCSELERILAHQSTPELSWQELSESKQETIGKLAPL